ncbi:MAG: hypothetical protein ISEC1_P1631 [Thiomicrorhabdus sp.]|nr:MAG: hypothetical protein ISEC1_P1631 [Thiomicrorhabdus sp.]
MGENSTNSKKRYEVTYADLPLQCPTPDMSKWNSHPIISLAIEETGIAKCKYCGAEYVLIDWDANHAAGH